MHVRAALIFCAWHGKMNPESVAALESFVQLHAHRLPAPNGEPLVYLVQYSTRIPLSVKLIAYTLENIRSQFDTEHLSVCWLLTQLQRTDHHKASLLGMYFHDGTVLAHTVKRGAVRDEDS